MSMLLSNEAGCPGKYIRTQGRTAAICYGCARHTKQGPQIEPRAALTAPGGEWACAERRSAGHVPTTVPAADEAVHPASVGGQIYTCNEGGSGCA